MNLTIKKSLSDKFKLLRKEQKMSQRGLADATGIHYATIGHLESGKIETISTDIFNKFVEHEELSKYALWLLNDNIDDKTIESMLAFLDELEQNDEATPDD